MVGSIYFVINKMTGKYYVGQTIQDIKVRWWHHRGDALRAGRERKRDNYLYRALRKYRPENFEVRILYKCFDMDTLNEAEKYFIKFFDSTNRAFGYNIKEGGRNGRQSESTKNKISKSLMGHLYLPETILKMSLSRIGIKASKETREKLSKIHKGKKKSETHK